MRHLKTYEEITIYPNVGDYVLCKKQIYTEEYKIYYNIEYCSPNKDDVETYLASKKI